MLLVALGFCWDVGEISSIQWEIKDCGSRTCGGTFRKPRGQGEGRIMQLGHGSSARYQAV